MTRKEKLLGLIESFLAVRKKGMGGSWPDVTEDEMNELWDILNHIILLKYEKDADGDLPVVYELVDRTKYHRLDYVPIPYTYRDKSEEKYHNALERTSINVSMAMRDHDIELRNYLHFMRSKQEEKTRS